jgi:hypothetical protein
MEQATELEFLRWYYAEAQDMLTCSEHYLIVSDFQDSYGKTLPEGYET